ncbi:MAG: SpoIIE family protein phosphatase [Acidobacteriia bacterium]|nr:SpoIIE family protein phosphatase [Terriglobia bacterium]
MVGFGSTTPVLSVGVLADRQTNREDRKDTMSSMSDVASTPVLLFVQGTEQRRIAIDHTPFTIGRKTDRDLPIPDSRVSREHASIIAEGGNYYIVDLGSRTGVYVNRMRRERHPLEPNDRCDFGLEDFYFVFQPTPAVPTSSEFLSQISMAPRGGAGSELQQLRLFLEAARRLRTTGVLADVIATLLDCTLRLTRAERGFVFLRGADGGLHLGAARTSKGETLRDDSTISHSMLQQAADSGSEFVVGDTSQSADLAGRASIMIHDLRTVIAIPLRRGSSQAADNGGARLNKAGSAPHPVLGVLYLDSRFTSGDLSGVSQDILHAIAKEAAGLLENAHLVEVEEAARRYQQELSIAARIQQRLMSVRIPDVPFAEVQGRNLPCQEIGGDFFDVVRTSDSIAVVLTDVSGKGVSAALLGSVIQGMIYSQLAQGISLENAVTAAHNFLCEKDVGDKYATMVVARLGAGGELELLNCGHVPPRLFSGGKITEPDNINPPIGLLPDVSFRGMRMQLKPGDRLILTTDGVVEAENGSGEFFGYERLDRAAAAGFESIFQAVKEFCGPCPLQDDCTVVELVYSAPKAAGAA